MKFSQGTQNKVFTRLILQNSARYHLGMPFILGRVQKVSADFGGDSGHLSVEFFWDSSTSAGLENGTSHLRYPTVREEARQLWAAVQNAVITAESLCRPPKMMLWAEAIKQTGYEAAKVVLLASASWKQFVEESHGFEYSYSKPNGDVVYAKGVTMGGLAWQIEDCFDDDQAVRLLNEIVRRDANNEQRFESLGEQKAFLKAPTSLHSGQRRESIPEAVRHEVWRRDLGRCVRCESQSALEFDHIIPFALGGSNTARNLQLLCQTCNRSKGATLGSSV